MAILLTTEGKSIQKRPANGKSFTLEEFYTIIGCEMVQMIQLADGRMAWMDEEGKFDPELQRNEQATSLLMEAGVITGDYVVGNVLLTSQVEGGSGADED